MLSIWNFLVEKYYQRQRKKQSTGRLTNSALKHIQSEEAESSRYKLINFVQRIAHVSKPSGAVHVVNLQEMSCTCLESQDQKLPCRHIMAVCVGVDKIIRIVLSSVGSMSPYIHEVLS